MNKNFAPFTQKIAVTVAAAIGFYTGATLAATPFPPDAKPKEPDTTYTLKKFNVTGNTLLSAEEINQLLAPYTGRPLSSAELHDAANELMATIRAKGAFLAKVSIPSQSIEDEARFDVIEGRLAQNGVILGKTSERVNSSVIEKTLTHILEPGSVVEAKKYERAILLTNDMPGLNGSENILFPGAKPGEARFETFPHDDKLVTGRVFADNFGSPYTGHNRIGGIANLNSPTGHAEKFVLSGYETNKGTAFVSLDASTPLGFNGLRGGIAIDGLNYKTSTTDSLHGTAQNTSIYLRNPFIRSRQTNLYGDLRYTHSSFSDDNNAGNVTDRVLDVGSLSLTGDHIDNVFGGGKTVVSVGFKRGNVNLDGNQAYKNEDANTAQTQGHFNSSTLTLSRLQHLTSGFQTMWSFQGQHSSKPLDASQSFSLGGPYGFSGYNTGEVFGDKGHMVHADLRYNFAAPLIGGQSQVSMFYEQGSITTHAVNVVGGVPTPGIEQHTYDLKTIGLGYYQNWSKLSMSALLGKKISNEIPVELLANDKKYQGWINLSYAF